MSIPNYDMAGQLFSSLNPLNSLVSLFAPSSIPLPPPTPPYSLMPSLSSARSSRSLSPAPLGSGSYYYSSYDDDIDEPEDLDYEPVRKTYGKNRVKPIGTSSLEPSEYRETGFD